MMPGVEEEKSAKESNYQRYEEKGGILEAMPNSVSKRRVNIWELTKRFDNMEVGGGLDKGCFSRWVKNESLSVDSSRETKM